MPVMGRKKGSGKEKKKELLSGIEFK